MDGRTAKRPFGRAAGLSLAGIGLALAGITIWMAGGQATPAEAIAPCVAHTNTSEELEFLSQLQAWRDQTIGGSEQLRRTAPLNAAAFGYAQFLADSPGAGGHYADGSNWTGRAGACGHDILGGGEGLAVLEGSGQLDVGPAAAVQVMTAEVGVGGVYIQGGIGIRCVGVGKAVSANGTKVAWVVLIFQTFDDGCVGEVTGGPADPSPSTSPSASPSASPTATRTATPTATATPTNTPQPRFAAKLTLVPGQWNLVTLPPGPIAEVLARAYGCYDAVYALDGTQWLRYSPDVPAYARSLTSTTGQAVWIMASDEDCGTIDL